MILNINKPAGITSHDVVNAVRKITGEKRVGHAGTLDPFATGVLVIAVGRQDTKKLGHINENSQKEYTAVLEFGKTSTTGDIQGEIHTIPDAQYMEHISNKRIATVLKSFIGDSIQTTPAYSAVKIQGEPAYKLARQGKTITMPKRVITIYDMELIEFKPPFATVRVTCSAGTYIRALAQDIAKQLGTNAYLTQLTRTRIGEFTIENSKTLNQISQLID
jgi:tRNA pseudouridine55 synthase